MSRRVRARGHGSIPVTEWRVCATAPGADVDPAALAWSDAVEASAPTAAACLRAAGRFSLDAPRRFDAEEWWFHARLPAPSERDLESGDEVALSFGGLATIADVRLDGAPLLESRNMFLRHERLLTSPDAGRELVVRCRSLDALLAARRPRPRWRAPMIEHQQLRWFRTTLLGRTPGWSPPAAAVGPWGGVTLERRRFVAVSELDLRASLGDATGIAAVRCRVRPLGGFAITRVELVLERGGVEHRAELVREDGDVATGRLAIPSVARWWPHTHGEPALYAARLVVTGSAARVDVELGAVGFREIAQGGDFALVVNGAPVFCRGACWTPLDVVSLHAPRDAYARALAQARDAGMNMLRIGGTMVYESDDFHDLADALGILVWQDFMFANMDYPEDDAAFAASVEEEARQVLARLAGRPSLAVLCGNSEAEQQAAMFGATREKWSPRLFHETLAALARDRRPDVPYWPSSAHGGAFPHEARTGTTSYYGVGAYMRPLDDARRSEVRFATECLAFANVPAAESLDATTLHALRQRTPRDLGAAWDFDDVRDHYVGALFRLDPTALRRADPERYLELGRAATAEVVAATFGEWRRAASRCRGALVWFLRDLWPCAGWGLVAADGVPKSAWWSMRRACAPLALHVSDEGTDGLWAHVANDRPERVRAELEIALFRGGEIPVGKSTRAVSVEGRSALALAVGELLEGFVDVTYAYRFGPPPCDLVVATLRTDAGAAHAFHFPLGLPSARELDVGLAAEARAAGGGAWELVVRTRRFAQSVVVEAEGFAADDAWFHLAPGSERTVVLRGAEGAPPPRGTVRALNAESAAKIVAIVKAP